MSDLSLNIMDQVFHFEVKPEDEDRLRACGEELDRQMRSIRESGRVLGYDQVAVMVALDLIWGALTTRMQQSAAKPWKVKLPPVSRSSGNSVRPLWLALGATIVLPKSSLLSPRVEA